MSIRMEPRKIVTLARLLLATFAVLNLVSCNVAGGNKEFPQPQNVPIPAGAEKVRVVEVPASVNSTSYWETSFETTQALQDVIDFYKTNLIPKGWSVESESSDTLVMKWVEDREMAPRLFTFSLVGTSQSNGTSTLNIQVKMEQR